MVLLMRKKIISLLLAFTLLFCMSTASFAASPMRNNVADEHTEGYVDVTDDEGNVYQVWVETSLYRSNNPSYFSSEDNSEGGGGYHEGDQIDVSVRISNSQLNLSGAVGSALTYGTKKNLASLAAKAMTPYVGAVIEGGIGLYTILVPIITSYNETCGNEGFEVTGTFEWTHFQHQIQGIDMMDWGLVGLDISTY